MKQKNYLIFIALATIFTGALGVWFYFYKSAAPEQVSSDSVRLYFEPETISAKPGESFTVALKIDPVGKKVTAQELYLSFNQNLVTLNRIATSTSFSVALMPAKIDNQSGQASIVVGVFPTSPVSETADVLYLNFSAENQIGEGVVKVEDKSQVAAIGIAANVLEGFGTLQLKIDKNK